MSEQTNNQGGYDSSQSDTKINNVVALTQLVGTIVDYYSFKNKLIEDEDEADKWKKSNGDENLIVPKNIDAIIEKSFVSQLNKFVE